MALSIALDLLQPVQLVPVVDSLPHLFLVIHRPAHSSSSEPAYSFPVPVEVDKYKTPERALATQSINPCQTYGQGAAGLAGFSSNTCILQEGKSLVTTPPRCTRHVRPTMGLCSCPHFHNPQQESQHAEIPWGTATDTDSQQVFPTESTSPGHIKTPSASSSDLAQPHSAEHAHSCAHCPFP